MWGKRKRRRIMRSCIQKSSKTHRHTQHLQSKTSFLAMRCWQRRKSSFIPNKDRHTDRQTYRRTRRRSSCRNVTYEGVVKWCWYTGVVVCVCKKRKGSVDNTFVALVLVLLTVLLVIINGLISMPQRELLVLLLILLSVIGQWKVF